MAKADLIIRNVLLLDGSGEAATSGDVAVTGERISAVGDLDGVAAHTEIDGSGLAVAPGFIDVHTHDDRYLLEDPSVTAKTSQGVTTVVVGNCGVSYAPAPASSDNLIPPLDLVFDADGQRYASMADYFAALDAAPAAANSVTLVGHSTLRACTMDRLDRPATDAEITAMRALLKDCLTAGAFGLSSGLFYPPATAAPTEELMAVAEELTDADGIYTAHIRDEADHLLEAMEEAAAIARHADIQLVLSHHKATGKSNFGKTADSLALVTRLQGEQRVTLDVYPYVAGSTVLLAHMVARASKVLITWSTPHPECNGRELAAIVEEWNVDLETAMDRLQPAGAIYFAMDEDDVQRVISFPGSMIGSDGIPHDNHPHPRLWGTFPRVLGHYARDIGLLPLEHAVRKMTGLPAEQFGLRDRGLLRPGFYADLVLFDPAAIGDTATFEEPTQAAAGIVLVMVNGQAVWQDGRATGIRPGQALRLADSLRGRAVA